MIDNTPIIECMSESPGIYGGTERLATDDVLALVDQLGRLRRPTSDTELVSQLEALERVKAAAAAAQASLAYSLARENGRDDLSVGAEIGLARRESPHRGGRLLDLARALVEDLPHTFDSLTVGDISEARALIIASETSQLSPADRRAADRELFPEAAELGDLQLRERARAVAFRLDDEAATRRQLQARNDRRVTGRSLGDGTARITAVVKEEHFAAMVRSLDTAAGSARAAGDQRTHGQIRADTLVERVTGLDTATPVPIRVDLVLDAETLLCDSPEPGRVSGGPLPAGLCRLLVKEASQGGRATLRRLYAIPESGELVALESRQRTFPRGLADLIGLRDGGVCRTPWCNAPVRHHDHVVPAREGAATTADNGQGLCERCNYVKELPGWIQWVEIGDGRHQVGLMTPAQHVYSSNAPPLPRATDQPQSSQLEALFAELVLAA